MSQPATRTVSQELSELTDGELLQLWSTEGNTACFTELTRRYHCLVRGVAQRQLGPDQADDTSQVVFAILARKASGLNQLRSLGAWLHRVTVLQCRGAVRRHVRDRRNLQAAMENALLEDSRDPLAEALPHLDEAIEALPDSDRDLILLRYSEGLGFAEAARRTGKNEAALRQQAGRALAKLSDQLRSRGVAVPVATLTAGLGGILSGTATAEAAALCASTALATAAGLSPTLLTSVSLATLSTSKSIAIGTLIAALIASGPLLWRQSQLSEAEAQALSTARTAESTPTPLAASVAGSKTSPDAAITGQPPATPPSPPTSTSHAKQSPAEELGALVTKEVFEAMQEWTERQAWLKARRAGLLLGLDNAREADLRNLIESLYHERFEEVEHTPELQRERVRKLEAWFDQNLTPEQRALRQETERNSRTALVEKLAEQSLSQFTTSLSLAEEQKNQLYQVAAGKALEAVDRDDHFYNASFGMSFQTADSPGVEIAAADVVSSVLDPAQRELWEQSLEQDRMVDQVLPRRVSDRVLGLIRERGLGAIATSLLLQGITGPSEPPTSVK